MDDLIRIKERQQQTWASGDFSQVATPLVIVSELLCEAVDLHAGQKVLDVASGSGNTALAAARRWCEVTGIDYVPALLERGRERATAERLPITFTEADAENIPFTDGAFDAVLSTFGSMFAPDQERAAREMLRVCRSGGKIGMANWTPDSFVGEMFRTTTHYVPQPPGLLLPSLWGTEDRLRELFGDSTTSLQVTRQHFVFRYLSARHWLEFFQTYFGPIVRAFKTLDAAARENLENDLLTLVQRFNRSGDDTVVMPSDYLQVVAVKG